eukprot:3920716-Amphidinium_carterae.1
MIRTSNLGAISPLARPCHPQPSKRSRVTASKRTYTEENPLDCNTHVVVAVAVAFAFAVAVVAAAAVVVVVKTMHSAMVARMSGSHERV